MSKKTKTFRMSEHGNAILKQLANEFDCTEIDVIELGLRLALHQRGLLGEILRYTITNKQKYAPKTVNTIKN